MYNSHYFLVYHTSVCVTCLGMLGMSLLAMIPATHHQFMFTCNKYYEKLEGNGVLSSIVGGSMLGIGMVLCGAVSICINDVCQQYVNDPSLSSLLSCHCSLFMIIICQVIRELNLQYLSFVLFLCSVLQQSYVSLVLVCRVQV